MGGNCRLSGATGAPQHHSVRLICALCALAAPLSQLGVNTALACGEPEDVNCDGWINATDIGIIGNGANFQKSPPADPRTDVNGDGYTNAVDIGLVANRMGCHFNTDPVADAGADRSATVDEPVSFDASASYDPNNSITSYAWDFGDGSEANGVQVAHSFALPGQYTVQLTVTNDCNATATSVVTVDVQGDAVVSADFNVDPNPADIMIPVTFTALAAEDVVMMYLWEFSDGGGGFGPSVTYAFDAAGDYTATLTAILYTGEVLVMEKPISVAQGLTLIGLVGDSLVTQPRGYAVVHDTAWAAGNVQTIATADVSDPENPVPVAEASLGGAPWHIAANESLVAVAASWGGIYLFDANRPDDLTPIGHFDTFADDGSSALKVALVGDMLYAACGPSLKIIDVSDPTSPNKVGSWQGGGVTMSVDVVAGRLYVFNSAVDGIQVLDISDPIAPLAVGGVGTLGRWEDLAIAGDLLALAEGEWGVEIFDISNPDAPVPIAHRSYIGSGPLGVTIRGSYLYVANVARVEKLNIENPTNPWLVQWISVGRMAYDLQTVGDQLFLAISQGVTAVLAP